MDAHATAVRRCSRSAVLFAALLSAACSPSGEATFNQGGATSAGAPAGAAATGAANASGSANGGAPATGGSANGGASTSGSANGGAPATGGTPAAAGTAPATGGAPTAGAGNGPTPAIPTAPADCPTIADGTITVLGQDVRIWTGPAATPGPLVFYWHGTNSVPAEAQYLLGEQLAEIQESGGVVASFSTTTAAGTSTGNRVWYTGDFEMADIILACAVQQGLVDARQIFTAGCSAGGLQAGAMIYGRSSYLAASMPNSGGIVGRPQLQDPEHVPAVITTHGGPNDFVIISFAESSAALDQDIREKGGFVVNCDHGGDHCQSPPEVVAAQWAFLKAHPYGVAPEPYEAGLPAGFPAACQIVQ